MINNLTIKDFRTKEPIVYYIPWGKDSFDGEGGGGGEGGLY